MTTTENVTTLDGSPTDYQTPERMAKKSRAIPLPDLHGKSVLDVGCDHAWWCWEAIRRGAKETLGLDRNRRVYGNQVDLIELNRRAAAGRPCWFQKIDLGKEWRDTIRCDVVFCFSVYHHIYENCGSHESVWLWLWNHTTEQLLWEGPTSTDDPVVRLNVSHPYRREDILAAAERYFHVEYVGPALHVKTREVWRCKPKELAPRKLQAKALHGSGGATAAFTHAGGRRIGEIQKILGFTPFPGSLNCRVKGFDWDRKYFRTQVLDVTNRREGLDSEWTPRWARFYPCDVGYAFRFEGETYKEWFVELIAPWRLRDGLGEDFELYV